MEVGIGHHGEPGIEVCPLESAASVARRMTKIVCDDLPFLPGDETVVLLSGLGATPLMELYILYDEVQRILASMEISVHRAYVGNYFTSLEMSGASLTVMKLNDRLKTLIDLDVYSVGLKQQQG